MTLKFHCSVSDGASPAVIERSIGFGVAEQRVFFIFYLLFFFLLFSLPYRGITLAYRITTVVMKRIQELKRS
ncbi:hypothetical protein BDQ94DRAFT_136071 [Aspergillus welwitschiae]|uniref:Uncharacterized protein n=1 Tax=Aspergillus welwitschiae TaxID=1341132 RepID=A0A3F3QDC1_9EURO|nr:hypothetical protein BDQ94DRAFT_136071 [Aspergillus welwitschiae]RDH37284.1 hypothetical protein BDQ94DRAFT_136071 [Aspergillus welwitschiae]